MEKFTVTFRELGSDHPVQVSMGDTVAFYTPTSPIATFTGWYQDENCTIPFDFSTRISADITIYSQWEYDETFRTVAGLMKNTSFGSASCFGTSACFNSVYFRVLTDDHGYYNGAAGIANYLKGVFTEDSEGNVSVSETSSLRRISYTPAMTVINFSSAFSSYYEYILRNGMELPEEIAQQVTLAKKYFNTVDDTAEGYHTFSSSGPYSFPSMAVAVVAMGSLLEQTDTARYDALIKAAYENVDDGFYNSMMYLQPFYQLCAKYSWFDAVPDLSGVTALTDADVLKCYGYGIDLANDYAGLWDAYVTNALSDNTLSAAEAKAFACHYAYQLTGGDAYLGIYGSSRAIVDFTCVTE